MQIEATNRTSIFIKYRLCQTIIYSIASLFAQSMETYRPDQEGREGRMGLKRPFLFRFIYLFM